MKSGLSRMFRHPEMGREALGNATDQKRVSKVDVSTGYKIVVGLLLLALVVVSLLSLQEINLLQLQNGQLLSHSSNLDQQNSELNKIVTLRETQVLANHRTVYWSAGLAVMPLELSCQCFQYSGYLHVNWTSTANLTLQVSQFGLNFTTPSQPNGDFRIPVGGKELPSASFNIAGCSISGCQATYSVIYHY